MWRPLSEENLFTGLCLLLLGLALFYFVRNLCVRRSCHRGSSWMHVSSVDRDGKQVGWGEWVRIPPPDRIDRNGLNHVVKYVARLVKSRSDDAHLIITSTDGNKACLICRDKDQLKIIELVYTGSSTPTTRKEPFSFPPHLPDLEKEQAIRNLFADLGIAAEKDFVHQYNGYVDAMRDLHYPIGSDIAQATAIIQRLLREVHHIRQSVDVIVNPWNRNIIPWWLLLPQGVSGAIKKRGGVQPFCEVARHGPITLGQAVLTSAGKLPFRGIIHVAGINMLWQASEYSIRQSVHSAMAIVQQQGFTSVAFPLIGAGSGSFNAEKSLGIILDELKQIECHARVVVVQYRR